MKRGRTCLNRAMMHLHTTVAGWKLMQVSCVRGVGVRPCSRPTPVGSTTNGPGWNQPSNGRYIAYVDDSVVIHVGARDVGRITLAPADRGAGRHQVRTAHDVVEIG